MNEIAITLLLTVDKSKTIVDCTDVRRFKNYILFLSDFRMPCKITALSISANVLFYQREYTRSLAELNDFSSTSCPWDFSDLHH